MVTFVPKINDFIGDFYVLMNSLAYFILVSVKFLNKTINFKNS